MIRHLSLILSVGALVVPSAARAASPEQCAALPGGIDALAAELPRGQEYVALAQTPSDGTAEPSKPDDVSEYIFLAGALQMYGECHLTANVPDADPTVARRYLHAAALLGNAGANHQLASAFIFQPTSAEERSVGVRMLREEYEAGSAFAAGKLGWAYHMGYGVPKDDTLALRFFEEAARGGMTLWQFLLAHVYEQGYYDRAVDAVRSEYWKQYPNKVHVYTYECAVAELYAGGLSFPDRPEVAARFADLCGR
jgi:TPR repeat protein